MLMDLVADYAATYHGPPDPDAPWPLVVALATRVPQFQKRQAIATMEGVGLLFSNPGEKFAALHAAYPNAAPSRPPIIIGPGSDRVVRGPLIVASK